MRVRIPHMTEEALEQLADEIETAPVTIRRPLADEPRRRTPRRRHHIETPRRAAA